MSERRPEVLPGVATVPQSLPLEQFVGLDDWELVQEEGFIFQEHREGKITYVPGRGHEITLAEKDAEELLGKNTKDYKFGHRVDFTEREKPEPQTNMPGVAVYRRRSKLSRMFRLR